MHIYLETHTPDAEFNFFKNNRKLPINFIPPHESEGFATALRTISPLSQIRLDSANGAFFGDKDGPHFFR